MKKLEWTTYSTSETEKAGEEIATWITGPVVIAMFGGLGMGKTAITRGIVRGLGIEAEVASPTFSLVNVYGERPMVAHFDMYRITSWEDLDSAGFFDYIGAGAVLLVEWSENIENALPADAWRLTFERIDDTTRHIVLEGT